MRMATAIVLGLCVLPAVAFPAAAVTRIYSYDSASPVTEVMTEGGLTFVFEKTLFNERVLKLVETHDIGEADLKPANESALGRGGLNAVIGQDANERELYEITDQADGKALKRALCHAPRVWLAFGRLKNDRPLRIHALTFDPVSGKGRLCITLDYAFHGQWALPVNPLPQPDRSDPFNDAPTNTRY